MICRETPKNTWNLYVAIAKIAILVVVAVKGTSLWKYIANGRVSRDVKSVSLALPPGQTGCGLVFG